MFTLSDKTSATYLLELQLNGMPVKVELDTGASVSVLNESTYRSMEQQAFVAPLQPMQNKLCLYTGQDIPVLG